MSSFGYSNAPACHPTSTQPHCGRAAIDDVAYAQPNVNRLPFYTFDPATLMEQSIETQLRLLHDGPEFDANPAHCSHDEPAASTRRNTYQGPCARNGSRSQSRLLSSGTLPIASCDSLTRSRGATQPHRPSSAAVLPSRTAARSPFASSSTHLRGTLPRQGGRWNRQQRKEGLTGKGLEPLQNLVGLDSYFVERPHFTYRPLSSSTAPPAGNATYQRHSLSRVGVSGALNRAGDGGSSSNAGAALTLSPHMVLSGSLPLASGRQAISAAAAGVAKTPSVASSTTTQTSSSSGTSGSSSSSSSSAEEVFFDEDPLNTRLVRGEVKSSVEPSKPSLGPQQKACCRHRVASVPEDDNNGGAPLNGAPVLQPQQQLLPLPSRDTNPVFAAVPPSEAPISVLRVTPQANDDAAPFLTAEKPPLPRAAPTVVVDLDRLAKEPRRRSVMELLERLLELRVQHQRLSPHATVERPSSAATSSVRAAQNAPACRAGNYVRTRRSAASRSTSSNNNHSSLNRSPASRSRRSARQSAHDLLYAANEDSDRADDKDDVYVGLYHRYRRCECCEVPLPQGVVRPQPPPRSHEAANGRRPRRGRRLPDAPRPESSPISDLHSKASHSHVAASRSRLKAACPSPSPAHVGETAAHPYAEEEGEAEEQEGQVKEDALHVDRACSSVAPTAERDLLQCFAQQEEEAKPDEDGVDRILDALRTFLQSLRSSASQHDANAQNEEDHNDSGGGNADKEACNEPPCAVGVPRNMLPTDVAVDDSLQAELLRLLSNSGRVPPMVPDSVQPQYEQQSYYGFRVPRPPHGGSTFARANPYAASESLYPYNIQHLPRRDESVEAVPSPSDGTLSTKVNLDDAGDDKKSTAQESKPIHQGQPVIPAASQAAVAAEAEAGPTTEEAPLEQQTATPPRVVKDKSVQTSLPSSRHVSVAERATKETGGAPTAFDAPAALPDKADMTKTEAKEVTFAPLPGKMGSGRISGDEAALRAYISPASISSFGASTLAVMRPPPSPLFSEKANALARAQEIGAPAAGENTIKQLPTDADVQAKIHRSVAEAQMQMLLGMESALRLRIDNDEADVWHAIVVRNVSQAETMERCTLSDAEAKELLSLQRGSRYGFDRLLVMEVALKEWSRALKEEQDAWTSLIMDAAAETAMLDQRAAAQARLRELIGELLYDEARSRQSIRFTESLMRQELQINICDYEENYHREDIDYAELVEWLGMQRSFFLMAPRPTRASSSQPSRAECSCCSREGKDAQVESCAPAEQGNCMPMPFPTPTQLLSNEKEEAVEAVTGATAAAARLPAAEMPCNEAPPKGAEDSVAGVDCKNDMHASSPPGPAVEEAAATAGLRLSNASSTASAMSGALVFGSGLSTPAPGAGDDVIAEAQPAPPDIAAATPNPSPQAFATAFASESAATPNVYVVVETLKESTVASMAPTAVTDVPKALTTAELSPSSPLTAPPQQASLVTPPENKDDSEAPALVTRAADGEVAARSALHSGSGTYAVNAESEEAPCGVPPRHESADAHGAGDSVSTSLVEVHDCSVTEEHEFSQAAGPVHTKETASDNSDTGIEGGSSSASSSCRHKRRQRDNVFNRTVKADAIELDEAGELYGSEDRKDDYSEVANTSANDPAAAAATAQNPEVPSRPLRETAVPSLQAKSMNYESSSTDDRRFLSPLSTQSEANTPHGQSQEDYSFCSTPASARPPHAFVQPKEDAGPTRERSHDIDRKGVQLSAALARPQQTSAPPPHEDRYHHHSDYKKDEHQGHSELLQSLSASSLSSPHLVDQDEEGEDGEGRDSDEEGNEAVETGSDVHNSGDSHAGSDEASEAASTSDNAGHDDAHDGDDADADDDGCQPSSCIGKDELMLMRERVSAMKAAAHDGVAGAGAANAVKVGHSFTNTGDRPRLSSDSQPPRHPERRTSRETSRTHLEEANDATALPDDSALTHAQQPVSSNSNGLQHDGDPDHLCVADSPAKEEEAPPEQLTYGDLASFAVTRSSPAGSLGNASDAMNKTQGTYFGSLDSDILTPITRRVRAQCWEENGAASPLDLDAAPRPPTPEFVRNVLAVQLKSPLVSKAASAGVRDSDPTAGVTREAALPELKRNSNFTDEVSLFALYGARLQPDISKDFPLRRGAYYVKADEGEYYEAVGGGVGSSNNYNNVEESYEPPHAVTAGPAKRKHSGAQTRGDGDGNGAAFPPPIAATASQRPLFPWEVGTVAATVAHSIHHADLRVAETNDLISLKQMNEDEWSSGAPNRFAQHRVRVPSPHPKVLRRNPVTNSEESTSASVDDDSTPCMTPNMNDTRFVNTVLDGSLPSEKLATAPMQEGVRMHLVNSESDSASFGEASFGLPS